jgi:hypothetical protein
MMNQFLVVLLSMACDVPYVGETGVDVQVVYPDADGDTILDYNEGNLEDDFDGDGTPNYLDEDSDDDTIYDVYEAGDTDSLTLPFDNDGDGFANFIDLDSDNNCILDRVEKGGDIPIDTDGDSVFDFADDDNDGDGIKDVVEIYESCDQVDSDADGTPDFMDTDSDNDGIDDLYEGGTTPWQDEPVDSDGDGTPDYLDQDSDNDGFSDTEEANLDSDGVPSDTDGDGLYDFADTDSDGDGLSDADEVAMYGTDPYDSDSDSDGNSDGAEVFAGTDPNDASSVVDGVYVEVEERTTREEQFNFELSILMGDIGFIVDTTGSMSGTLTAIKSEYAAIVSDLSLELPDAEYGVATFDDYYYAGYGSSGDQPFFLHRQITNDMTAVQSALNGIGLHSGADGPESGMEALYQGATGIGYDQNCNHNYDGSTDVRPFMSSISDPFNGGGGQFYSASYSGGGTVGGFGFRDYALPVLVYATDNYLRDPDAGYGTPNGCPTDAGSGDVIGAMTALGGYLIGIDIYGTATPQMNQLAMATNSYGDTNGDGIASELLVFNWSSSSSAFRTTVVNAVKSLVSGISFETISLEIEGDEWGFVTGVDPEYVDVSGAVSGELVDFTLEFLGTVTATAEDQLFLLTLNIVGDGTILLDTLDIIVVVPGTSA